MNLPNLSLILAVIASALIAGLYYAYSCSVNPGLAKLPDAQYVSAMQSINESILNPAFFMSFFGTLILLPAATYFNYNPFEPMRFWLLVAASVCYAAGSFGVTLFGNLPLNDMLAAVDLKSATEAKIHSVRAMYEAKWNAFHSVRTAFSVLALVLSAIACAIKMD